MFSSLCALSLLLLTQLAASEESISLSPVLGSNCSTAQITEIEDRRRACVAKKEEAFQENGGEKTQAVLCSFIDQIIEECSKEYETCYDARNMKMFQSKQLKIFEKIVQSYPKKENLELNVCSTYKKYMSDGLNGKCNVSQIEALNKKYGTCMNKAQQYLEPKDQENLKKVACKISTIIGECSSILRECFDEDKIQETNLVQQNIIDEIAEKTKLNPSDLCAGAGSLVASITMVIGMALFLSQ